MEVTGATTRCRPRWSFFFIDESGEKGGDYGEKLFR
tara:strand:- start:609 stop:716 length:108 start_codon:yes stop_codon:yes gene_type:complete